MIGWLLIVAGLGLFTAGAARARGPWARYRALREQEANIARYEAWRGGSRPDSRTGSSVAMDVLRRRAQVGAGIVIAGFVLVVAGFLVR